MRTRIAHVKGFEKVLLGRDLNDVFKEGHIYGFENILGQIVVKDLGQHQPLPNGYEGDNLVGLLMNGNHLHTEQEVELRKKLLKD